MEITAQDFRDSVLSEITIGYDWGSLSNYAIIKIMKNHDMPIGYRINNLNEYNIFEDFDAMHIEQCFLSIENQSVYLSLDPYSEEEASKENDNYYFCGKSIERL